MAKKSRPAEVEVEPQDVPVVTGLGTSTGTTTLAVASVTGTIIVGSSMVGAGVPAGTSIVAQLSGPPGGAGTYRTSVATTLAGIPLTFTAGQQLTYFPAFTPIVPPPVIGVGGGPPPAFPPPTPPPIGHVPVGVLVGPAISPAPVPPSQAGFTQPQFKTGSATSPGATGYFPKFTTTFPVPTIVVGGNNFATANPTPPPAILVPKPPQTPSTPPISIASLVAAAAMEEQPAKRQRK